MDAARSRCAERISKKSSFLENSGVALNKVIQLSEELPHFLPMARTVKTEIRNDIYFTIFH